MDGGLREMAFKFPRKKNDSRCSNHSSCTGTVASAKSCASVSEMLSFPVLSLIRVTERPSHERRGGAGDPAG